MLNGLKYFFMSSKRQALLFFTIKRHKMNTSLGKVEKHVGIQGTILFWIQIVVKIWQNILTRNLVTLKWWAITLEDVTSKIMITYISTLIQLVKNTLMQSPFAREKVSRLVTFDRFDNFKISSNWFTEIRKLHISYVLY